MSDYSELLSNFLSPRVRALPEDATKRAEALIRFLRNLRYVRIYVCLYYAVAITAEPLYSGHHWRNKVVPFVEGWPYQFLRSIWDHSGHLHLVPVQSLLHPPNTLVIYL